MKESTAATVGLLVAPAIPALVLGAMTPVTTREAPDLVSAVVLFPIGYAFSALFTGLFGLPAFLLGRHLRLIRWWSAVMVGFLLGVLVVVIIGWPGVTLHEAIPYALTGAASGLLFWIIWERRDAETF